MKSLPSRRELREDVEWFKWCAQQATQRLKDCAMKKADLKRENEALWRTVDNLGDQIVEAEERERGFRVEFADLQAQYYSTVAALENMEAENTDLERDALKREAHIRSIREALAVLHRAVYPHLLTVSEEELARVSGSVKGETGTFSINQDDVDAVKAALDQAAEMYPQHSRGMERC